MLELRPAVVTRMALEDQTASILEARGSNLDVNRRRMRRRRRRRRVHNSRVHNRTVHNWKVHNRRAYSRRVHDRRVHNRRGPQQEGPQQQGQQRVGPQPAGSQHQGPHQSGPQRECHPRPRGDQAQTGRGIIGRLQWSESYVFYVRVYRYVFSCGSNPMCFTWAHIARDA